MRSRFPDTPEIVTDPPVERVLLSIFGMGPITGSKQDLDLYAREGLLRFLRRESEEKGAPQGCKHVAGCGVGHKTHA